jgi:tetratricopeptide (TPR) repeat protein
MAQQQSRYTDALAAYDRSLLLDPGNRFAIWHRIATSQAMGDDASALRDAAAEIAKRSDDVDMYLLRANILRRQGKRDEAIAEAAALVRANPDNVEAQVTAARIYDAFGKQHEAMAAFDRALAIKPESYIYINRALSRPKADLDGRRVDIDLALKLDPSSSGALAEKARMQTDARDFEGALATAGLAVAADPKSPYALVQRGMAYERASKPGLAAKDFDAAKAMAHRPNEFNSICWAKAVAGVALDRALAECDAALAGAPNNAAAMDSKGLVLLRLGRVDDAISMYDAALAKRPQQSSSLYGRGLARLKKGDTAAANQDRKAALALDPDVVETYADFGLSWN